MIVGAESFVHSITFVCLDRIIFFTPNDLRFERETFPSILLSAKAISGVQYLNTAVCRVECDPELGGLLRLDRQAV